MSEPTDQSLTAKADAAFRQAAAKVVRIARQTGTSIIVWDRGGIRAISPDEAEKRMADRPADSKVSNPG
jgi:hypothetical protein